MAVAYGGEVSCRPVSGPQLGALPRSFHLTGFTHAILKDRAVSKTLTRLLPCRSELFTITSRSLRATFTAGFTSTQSSLVPGPKDCKLASGQRRPRVRRRFYTTLEFGHAALPIHSVQNADSRTGNGQAARTLAPVTPEMRRTDLRSPRDSGVSLPTNLMRTRCQHRSSARRNRTKQVVRENAVVDWNLVAPPDLIDGVCPLRVPINA